MGTAFNVGPEGREFFALKDKDQDLLISKIEDIGISLQILFLIICLAILGSKVLVYIHAGIEA